MNFFYFVYGEITPAQKLYGHCENDSAETKISNDTNPEKKIMTSYMLTEEPLAIAVVKAIHTGEALKEKFWG